VFGVKDAWECGFLSIVEYLKGGAKLIKELNKKLKLVESEVRDAFKELDEEPSED
jgi:exonuclease VII small subunit